MWLIHPKKDREAPVTKDFKLAALITIFCFVAGFALPGHAQQAPSYRQQTSPYHAAQVAQLLLFFVGEQIGYLFHWTLEPSALVSETRKGSLRPHNR